MKSLMTFYPITVVMMEMKNIKAIFDNGYELGFVVFVVMIAGLFLVALFVE